MSPERITTKTVTGKFGVQVCFPKRDLLGTQKPEVLWTRLNQYSPRGYLSVTIKLASLQQRLTLTFPSFSHEKLIEIARKLPAGEAVTFSLSKDYIGSLSLLQMVTEATQLIKIIE